MNGGKMDFLLFPHNQKAFEAAEQLMKERGKAAVIHPTGTGKSFLGFQLAMKYPDAKIIWLSPSEYIYQTQLENLKQSLIGSKEEVEQQMKQLQTQIQFLTYSKLMRIDEELDALQLDYLILDEFHRCGALEWGKSVRKLLELHKGAKVLGLSATHIRYLNQQRDMAEELFEGCIASHMTLGEAIAKQILPTPKYVISMYAYQEELKRLQKRVKNEKNPVLKEQNEKLLVQLKRSLEHAEGLHEIFRKHIEKPDGKYIVFCSGKEHMQEMMSHVKEWFGKVDEKPHVYEVTYDNPLVSKQFLAFKEDNSQHLKLLFCIDMLNEGVHIEEIDGVVLLRPTVSPILYLQQIGRALSTGKNKSPIIFDIVNNFESLYAIDAIQADFQKECFGVEAEKGEVQKYREAFWIIDELRDSRQLFAQLNRNLSASWEVYFQEASQYFEAKGHLDVPNDYVTETGLQLGIWLLTQRRVYAGKADGKLTAEKIQKLERIGMKWENRNDQKFWRGYEALQHYQNQYGNVDIQSQYVTEDGFALGKWVSNLRTAYKNGRLNTDRKEMLDALGMIWDMRTYRWNQSYEAAKAYFNQYGTMEIPSDYVTEQGISLGTWIQNQREIYHGNKENAVPLTIEQIEKLEQLPIPWQNKYEERWQNWYRLAEDYYKKHGNLQMRSTYCHQGTDQKSYALGKWIHELRMARKAPETSNRKLTPERIRQMDAIGMNWE